jgi:outer membrane protein assembly factor BamB
MKTLAGRKQNARRTLKALSLRTLSVFAGACLALSCAAASAQVNILTRSNDTARTGANLNESILTPANVNPTTFGKLFTVPTDGQLYTQPLYVSNLPIAGGTHNVVYAATMLNSIYAIDADTGASLWTKNYGTPIAPKEVESDQNITWNTGIGILGTPVIDPETNYMYFVTGNEAQVNGAPAYSYNLNAIDITTGDPVLGSPVAISATYSTADLVNPIVFNAKKQNQRPALALGNGSVYITFASHEDSQPYHGWVLAYSASTLKQTAVYSDTTTGIQGGIWNAGGAPTLDANGNVYISTGNGSFGTTPNGLQQTGNSFIKLSPQLQLLDYFTPYNSASLNSGDQDLGSSGLLLIPGTNYLLGGGKQGVLYLDDSTNMGKFNSSTDQVKQEFRAIYGKGTSHIHGSPVYFNSAVNGPTVYVWGENDVLRAFTYNPTTSLLNTTPLGKSTMTAPVTNNDGAMPGGFLSISANGNANGIVWASTPYNGDAVHASVQGVLYAFDANTLQLLWSDKDADARDEVGTFAKYVPPVVANGKLYVSTFGPTGNPNGTGALVVYGLLTPQVTISPSTLTFPTTLVGSSSAYQQLTVTNAGSTLHISGVAPDGANASSYGIREQTCGATLASGASCTFDVVFRPTVTGPLPVNIGVFDDAAGSPQLVSVTGTGNAVPNLVVSPASLTFPSTTVGSTSAAQVVTVNNTGHAVMDITSISVTGANASSFSISQQTCGATLAAASSCTFYVSFKPTNVGSLPATLAFVDNANGSPQHINIAATGDSGLPPVASLSPTSLTFPNTQVGSTAAYQQMTLSNTGKGVLNITAIAPSGANASSYGIRLQTCGTTLAAGTSCTFSVAFRPTYTGPLPATLSVFDNAAGSPQTAPLTGNGYAIPVATLSVHSLTFGSTNVGSTSATQAVKLSNTGSAVLNITSIASSGTNASSFVISQQTCGTTLAAGASCTFSVAFAPKASGALTGSIAFTDNANGSPQLVSLAGTGIGATNAKASASPGSLSFPTTAVGSASAYQQVTLTNTGNAVMNIVSIAPQGANASSYGIRQQMCASTLAAGASCTFSVVFRPNTTGELPADVAIFSNALNSPLTVSVSGAGR